jgi:hypothetical protein
VDPAGVRYKVNIFHKEKGTVTTAQKRVARAFSHGGGTCRCATVQGGKILERHREGVWTVCRVETPDHGTTSP